MTKTALTLALAGCLAAAQGLLAQQAQQQQRSATLRVTAEVVRDCRIIVNALAFGAYDPIGANSTQPLDATTTIEVTCTQGVSAKIKMDGGSIGQNVYNRQMAGPAGARLTYHIYKDAQRTITWGSGTFPGPLALDPAPSTAPRTIVVYGRAPAAQAVPAGSYADEVVVLIEF